MSTTLLHFDVITEFILALFALGGTAFLVYDIYKHERSHRRSHIENEHEKS